MPPGRSSKQITIGPSRFQEATFSLFNFDLFPRGSILTQLFYPRLQIAHTASIIVDSITQEDNVRVLEGLLSSFFQLLFA